MDSGSLKSAVEESSLVSPGQHSMHECRSVEEFRDRFRTTIGFSAEEVADSMIDPPAPRAIFLVGSIPLGMATSGSDVDFIVVVDDKSVLTPASRVVANSGRQIAFFNEDNPLLIGSYVTSIRGVAIEVQLAVASAICNVNKRLRRRGPELTESETIILSRLATGWRVWESERYLESKEIIVSDPALDIYCCTRHFVTALNLRQKAISALEFADIPLVIHLVRQSVESCYLAFFASEGLSYLGARWMAQLGYARGASERQMRYPLLKQGISLLFPSHEVDLDKAKQYLGSASEFLTSMRSLIGQRTPFRIAFQACPQIHPV